MTSDAAPLAPGSAAPNFELPSTPDQKVSLEDFRGQPVILAFYPADWSPVCADQLALYQELLQEFQRYNAELLGISVDGDLVPSGIRKGPQPALPAAGRLRAQGRGRPEVRRVPAQDGTSERALYVIDADGVVAWSYVSPVDVNPGADGILRALEA